MEVGSLSVTASHCVTIIATQPSVPAGRHKVPSELHIKTYLGYKPGTSDAMHWLCDWKEDDYGEYQDRLAAREHRELYL
jgi:hypothetical protein